jgi:hypothetical protein
MGLAKRLELLNIPFLFFAVIKMNVSGNLIHPGFETSFRNIKRAFILDQPVKYILGQVFAGGSVKSQLQKEIIQFHMVATEQLCHGVQMPLLYTKHYGLVRYFFHLFISLYIDYREKVKWLHSL